MIESNEWVVCVNNADFGDFSAADLIVGKCYEVLAWEEGWLRIMDESGEDYLYPVARFVPVARSPEAAYRFREGLERAGA